MIECEYVDFGSMKLGLVWVWKVEDQHVENWNF